MSKKCVFLLALIAMLLSGCASGVGTEKTGPMFVSVYYGMYCYVVYEKDTKVMYAVSDGAKNRGTFTLLVNADGTPMIWKEADDG
nr:MAG TPA: outer membrane protein assembly factor [Caudoviricetes sp.]